MKKYDYSKYTVEGYTAPFWRNSRIGNESVLFFEDEPATLLFENVEVESVMSFDLKKKYDSREYMFEDGKLFRTKNSSIPFLTQEEYYPEFSSENTKAKKDGGNVLFSEGNFFSYKQVVVTYKHLDDWKGFIPLNQNEKFKDVLPLIKSGKQVNVVFFGDSITAGCNASKTLGFAPFADRYSDQVVEYLKRRYNNSNIISTNVAVGGKDSEWGIQSVEETLKKVVPDLAVVAFGMNDVRLTPKEYVEKIETMTNMIFKANKKANLLIVAPMLPNPEAEYFYKQQPDFEKALIEWFAEREQIAIAPVTSMHKSLLARKKYADMTGNNINHPNDFLVRIYAQTLLKTMLGEDFCEL